jgi:hypothetical protein
MKNVIRAIVWAAILTWPGVETYRWWAAEQDLASRRKVETRVLSNLAAAKQSAAQQQMAAQTKPEPH